jgi:hypothetical protein
MKLDFPDTCLIYPNGPLSISGRSSLGEPATVPCLYVQTTAYQHGSSQDAIVGTPVLALPPDDVFVLAHSYRLEEMVVEVNPFTGAAAGQRFKIASVTVARDVLLANEVQHIECELKKIETPNVG